MHKVVGAIGLSCLAGVKGSKRKAGRAASGLSTDPTCWFPPLTMKHERG